MAIPAAMAMQIRQTSTNFNAFTDMIGQRYFIVREHSSDISHHREDYFQTGL
jgi:hypothetical protein